MRDVLTEVSWKFLTFSLLAVSRTCVAGLLGLGLWDDYRTPEQCPQQEQRNDPRVHRSEIKENYKQILRAKHQKEDRDAEKMEIEKTFKIIKT